MLHPRLRLRPRQFAQTGGIGPCGKAWSSSGDGANVVAGERRRGDGQAGVQTIDTTERSFPSGVGQHQDDHRPILATPALDCFGEVTTHEFRVGVASEEDHWSLAP